MERFGRSPDGRAYDIALHQSGKRLHELVPEVDPTIFNAYLTIGRTWSVLSKMGDKYSANLGLTPYQRHALRFLLVAENQRLTLGELAGQLETSSANTTKLVNRMQRAGMVRREVDFADRRVVWVVLTPLGGEKYLAALPISDIDREAFSILTEDEQESLIDLLTRVQEKAVELLGNVHGRPPENSREAALDGLRHQRDGAARPAERLEAAKT